MSFKIGFTADHSSRKPDAYTQGRAQAQARRSIVNIYFPARNMKLSYYNDEFDLHRGDIVYVDGKLEGLRGRVVDVNYNFRIRLSDYKRVIALADTDVHGDFYRAGSHFVTFDPDALSKDRVRSWYMAPKKDCDEFASGSDGSDFLLGDLNEMNVPFDIAERGNEYYMENRVRYITLDGTRGYAIVEGRVPYEVEFGYDNGRISGLVCSCYCAARCKHEFSAMLQLRETLELVNRQYASMYERSEYFAAIYKAELFSLAVDGKETGSFTL